MGDVIRGGFAGREGSLPPEGGNMEARIAKLEASVSHIETAIMDIKADIRDIRNIDIRDIRNQMKIDFRVLFGSIIFIALGLAGLMAKGFGWL